MKKLIIIAFFLYSVSFFSQGYFKHHELTIPSPNTAELGKYGFIPVNKYTGIPSISIPIYEMDFDGLKIPLSLSYHASGIKVSQESSWVGLGWSLTSNAIITRSINQVSDIGSRKRVSANRIGDYGYAFEQEIPDTYNSAYEEYLESHFGVLNIDTQPDIFVANLFGRTVKFILTQKDSDPSPIPSERRIKVQLLDEGNEKIWYNDYSKNFTLTDDRGFTYYFDKKEYSTNVFREKPDELFYDEYCDGCLQFSFESDVHIITAWYVTKIISPHGKTLDFNYYLDGEENSYFISISQPTHNQTRTDTQCFVGQNDGSAKFESLNSPIQTVQEIVYLKDITDLSNGNRIVFKISDREDLIDSETWNGGPGATCKLPGSVYSCISTGTKSPKKLSEIQIINSRGKIKKRVNFNYSYFNSDKINDVRKQSYLRLKLDGINVDDQEYKFVYNQPNSLPKKTSKDVDFFGFYNGANNQFIYPSITVNDSCFNGTPFTYVKNDAKRGSNFTYGQVGLLNKIEYPTKGSTEFYYESHTAIVEPSQMPYTHSLLLQNNLEPGYPQDANASGTLKNYKIGGARIAKTIEKDNNGTTIKAKRYKYDDLASTSYPKSYGKLMNRMIYYVIGDGVSGITGALYTNAIITSRNMLGTENAAQGNHIGYSKVEEIIINKDDTDDIGRIVTTFENQPNETANSSGFIIANSPPYHFEAKNGKVLDEKIYNKNGDIVNEVSYQYSYDRIPIANAFKIFYINLTTIIGGQQGFYNQVINYYPYNVYKTIHLQTEKRENRYENGMLISQNSRYTYNEKNLVASVTSNSSESEVSLKTENYYPFDQEYGVSLVPFMGGVAFQNRITEPVYTRHYRNNNLVKHTLIRYGDYEGILMPSSIQENKEELPFDQMDTRVSFVNYDDYANLLEMSRPKSAPISYVWGYDKQYLVAKIENASRNEIDIDSITAMDIINDSNTSDITMSTELDKIRQSLPNAMVSTYTYDPLVGVTTITNPKGYSTNYIFDDNERLLAISDDQDFLIAQNDYRYKDQTDFCLDCGSTISLSTNKYSVELESVVTLNITLAGFSNVLKWELDYGDGTILKGTGSPSSSYSHTYTELGLKVAKLFVYTDENNFTTSNTNILVQEKSEPVPLPGGDVYFSNIVPSGPGATTARLNGDPGAVVTYTVRTGGANSAQSGLVYVGDVGTSVSLNQILTRTAEIPSGGYLDCTVQHISSDGTSQGGTNLTLVSTTIGQIGSPSSVGDSFSIN